MMNASIRASHISTAPSTTVLGIVSCHLILAMRRRPISRYLKYRYRRRCLKHRKYRNTGKIPKYRYFRYFGMQVYNNSKSVDSLRTQHSHCDVTRLYYTRVYYKLCTQKTDHDRQRALLATGHNVTVCMHSYTSVYSDTIGLR